MKFLYPEFLWFLLILLIPIIIHLFNFKRYKTLYFSSLNFIKHVDQKTRSTQNLKHYLILASRLLAFLFIVLAFAQPYIPSNESEAIKGKRVLCIYIDNSYSMQSRGVEGELLSEAREKAKELVEASSLGDNFLVFTNELAGRETRILNRVEALEKIETTAFSPLHKTIDQVVVWQQEQLAKNQVDPKGSSFYLFSDFQKSTMGDKLAANKAYKGNFFPIQLIPESFDNLFIDSLWFDEPNHQINKTKELHFRIKNNAAENVVNAEIVISVGPFKKTIFVDVPAKGNKKTMITYSDKTHGIKKGEIKVMDKHVFFDDAYYFSYKTVKSIHALILNGPDQVDNIKLTLELDKHYVFVEKDISSLIKRDLDAAEIVYINGVNELSSGLQSMLQEFCASGGTVALFPGSSPNKSDWNGLLDRLDLARIGNEVGSGTKIKTLNYKDAFFTGMFEKETDDLNLPAVAKVFLAQKNSNNARTIIELQNGLPLLSYTKRNGRAFMFYSSLTPDYGKFSSNALFPSLILRMAETSIRKKPLAVEIGKEVNFPIYESFDTKNALHVKNAEFDFIPSTSNIAGIIHISMNKLDNYSTLSAGNYDVVSDKVIGSISLNYNRSESSLELLTEEEIVSRLQNEANNSVKYSELSSDQQFSASDIDKPLGYWKICIVLTLIFVLAEMMLVRFLK